MHYHSLSKYLSLHRINFTLLCVFNLKLQLEFVKEGKGPAPSGLQIEYDFTTKVLHRDLYYTFETSHLKFPYHWPGNKSHTTGFFFFPLFKKVGIPSVSPLCEL